jgi:transposase
MDVDAKRISGVCLDWSDGLKVFNVSNSAEEVIKYVKRRYPGKRIVFVYEAGPTGFGLYDELTRAGEKCIVAAPSMVPKAPGQRVKTNRLDAHRLAINLRGGQIEGIHIPSELYRDLRHLVQWRDTCVKEVGRNMRRIKSLLLLEGYQTDWKWTLRQVQQLKTLECRPVIGFRLNQLLEGLEGSIVRLKMASQQLQGLYTGNEELHRCMEFLQSVPGVGWITASHFLARVGGWTQLTSGINTCGFLGLGASEHSTGERINRGSITGVGDRRLRAKLIQCATWARKKDPDLAKTFNKVFRNNPSPIGYKKATVAVARKLAIRMHVVLKEQRFFSIQKQQEADSPGQTRPRPRAKETRTSPEARFVERDPGNLPPVGGVSNSV